MNNTINKLNAAGVSALVALSFATATLAQTHNWNLKARERAENCNSAAINFLLKGPNAKGALDQAIALLVTGTQADPTDPVPFATLGLAYDVKERNQDALEALAKSYKLDQKSTETLLSLAITHYLGHNYDKGLVALQNILKKDPKFCFAHLNMGYNQIRLGALDKARKEFQESIACGVNAQPAYQGIALIDYLSGDLAKAADNAEHAQNLTSYAPVLLLQTEISALRGDTEGLKTYGQRLSKVKKPIAQRPMVFIGYSKQHDFKWDPYLADQFDNASLIAARTADNTKDDSKQKSLANKGKVQDAIASVQNALSTAPNDYFLLRQLGLLNIAAGDYAVAVDQLNKVLTLCPQDHVDFLYLGEALALSGKIAEGSSCIRQYQQHFPQEQLAPRFLAIAEKSAAPVEPATKPAAPPVTPQENNTGF